MRSFLMMLSVAGVAALCAAQPALAQAPGGTPEPFAGGRAGPGNPSDPNPVRSTVETTASRLGSGSVRGVRRDQGNPRRNQAEAQQSDPAAVLAAAQEQAAASGTECQVQEAVARGQIGDAPVFEASCATGPGYLFVASTPPQALDCVLLGSQAQVVRERDPNADVGAQCSLPANQDVLRVVAAYSVQAGVTCTVDEGRAAGRSPAGNIIYEVGCANAQGYWLEKTASGWDKTECLEVVSQSAVCRFTTTAEGAASVKAMLAGSDAAGCDVTQARFMGENSNGRFYEAKCAAGDGFIARIQETAVQQVYPCQEAQRIGGGCTLTQVAAAPATTEQN